MSDDLLERARAAASAGEWQHACDLLSAADSARPLAVPDLALLADVAYAAGHVDVTIEAWERAHAQSLREGDPLTAAGAAARVAMHLLFDTALMAPIRGWVGRAERLLEGREGTPVHAWLAVVRSYERLLSGDFDDARVWARRAIEIGAQCDHAAAAIGRIAEARALILGGEAREGLALLDEAAVAAVSGELEPVLTGLVYCELVCALQALAQYDLAEEWTQAMERWRHGQPLGSLHGRCRVHRAEILRLRGSNREAEQEALLACAELRPFLRRELGWPLTELGRIRLRMGDIDGAERAFVAAHRAGWDPQPGPALAHLARGELTLAAASIRDAIEHPSKIPSKELPPNTELRRAPLLEAQAEIATASGDLERARWAAAELENIATMFDSSALLAGAVAARASVRLAEGDAPGARHDFEHAVHLWNEIGAPYETAIARLGLGRAHATEGNRGRAITECEAARSIFEGIGATLQAEHAARVRARLDDATGLDSQPNQATAAALVRQPVAMSHNMFHREGEYWTVAFAGHTLRLRDGKGPRYLASLLAAPGRELHVLELVAMARDGREDSNAAFDAGEPVLARGDAGALLDGRAKDAYRRRLAEIDEDIEEARAMGDVERESQAETERGVLIRELSRAVGLGGRDRRAGSATERARVAVTRAVRSTVARVRAHDPPLGEHLDRCIRTGAYCAYVPDPLGPTVWTL